MRSGEVIQGTAGVNMRNPKRTVMLVDPRLISREGTKALLEQDPRMEVVADCAGGAHAIALCTRHSPEVVVIDSDVTAPPLVETVTCLRCLSIPPAIVVLAATANDTLVRDAFECGASAFIVRDAGYTRLQQAIHCAACGEVLIDAFQLNRMPGDPNPAVRDPSVLSDRETQVLRLISSGLSTRQIATLLHLSPKTVESHRSHIYAKLDVKTLVDLTKYAMAHGLAEPLAINPEAV